MELLRIGAPKDRARLERLINRRSIEPGIEVRVRLIVEAVRQREDAALIQFTRQFDGVKLSPSRIRLSRQEIEAGRDAASPALVRALKAVKRNVEEYHRRQRRKSWTMRARSGARLAERLVPLGRVGVYVPGGMAPLVSTVLMSAVPARVAGVAEVVVATPPGKRGRVGPGILAACALCGIEEVYQMGGAHAVAALAYGTPSVTPVEKIVGPGNIFVTTAKRLVYGTVGLDAPYGPSEVLVIADGTADPRWVAADIVSQAEHGTGYEFAVLVTTSTRLAQRVSKEIPVLLDELALPSRLRARLERAITLVVAPGMPAAIEFANAFAAEHVEIMARDARRLSGAITNAGAIFIGPYSPVAVGDFAAGPSHCLPTGGAARMFSGLSVDDFVRRVSTIECSKAALEKLAPLVEELAEAERLPAHARAVRARLER